MGKVRPVVIRLSSCYQGLKCDSCITTLSRPSGLSDTTARTICCCSIVFQSRHRYNFGRKHSKSVSSGKNSHEINTALLLVRVHGDRGGETKVDSWQALGRQG